MSGENKEWTVMKAEPKPSVEVPNLWGVIKPEDVSHKYGGVDYMPWILVKKYVKEYAPGWEFRLLPLQDADQPNFLHKAPDGTAYVLAQWFHKPTGFKLPEFIHSVMDHKNKPVPLGNVDARLLTDTHRRAMASSAADAFGLAGELWARMPIEDPYRDLQDAQPKGNPYQSKQAPKKQAKKAPPKKASNDRRDNMLRFFEKHSVSQERLEEFLGCKLEDASEEQINNLALLGGRISKGANPEEVLTREDEADDEQVILL